MDVTVRTNTTTTVEAMIVWRSGHATRFISPRTSPRNWIAALHTRGNWPIWRRAGRAGRSAGLSRSGFGGTVGSDRPAGEPRTGLPSTGSPAPSVARALDV